MNIVFLDKQTIASGDLDLSAWYQFDLQWQEYESTATQDVLTRIIDADIVLTNKVQLTAVHFSKCPNLKLIILTATGTNNVDLEAAKAHNIAVCNMVDYCTDSVAQHTMAVMLSLVTRLNEYQAAIKNGEWQSSEFFGMLKFPVRQLNEMSLGIAGYGVIGQAVARLAQSFGMQVLICESLTSSDNSLEQNNASLQRLPLEELLKTVDVLTLHCPLTEQSKNLITKRELALMKNSALLINTARGGIVNESDLLQALKNKTIAGAALDVLSQEPPPKNQPLIDAQLANLILTPHSAWGSQQARQTMVNQTTQLLLEFLTKGTVTKQRVV